MRSLVAGCKTLDRVITQDLGMWRTIDSSASWNSARTFINPHSGSSLYRAKTSVFYLGGKQ
jgi:hypothetical protein